MRLGGRHPVSKVWTWVRHSCKIKDETYRGTDTQTHLTVDPTGQTQRNQGVYLGSAGCLLVNGGLERDSGVLSEGLQGGGGGAGHLGVCRGRRPGARSCPMLPGETLARL